MTKSCLRILAKRGDTVEVYDTSLPSVYPKSKEEKLYKLSMLLTAEASALGGKSLEERSKAYTAILRIQKLSPKVGIYTDFWPKLTLYEKAEKLGIQIDE